MTNPASYILSAYSFISKLPLEKILEVGNQTNNENPIPSFDEKVLIDLCSEVQKIFENEDNILELSGDLIIVGDIHGSLHDLLRILKFIDENNARVLFLGDYVDRGEFSLECITILFAMKVMKQDSVYLIRGNHEFDSLCSQYGFKKEIDHHHNPRRIVLPPHNKVNKTIQSILTFNFEEEEEEEEKPTEKNNCDEYYENRVDANCYRYSPNLYEAFIKAFSYLPICSIINNTSFCIHGGLSPILEKVDLIRTAINRPINTFEENNLLSDLTWSDPSNHANMFSENHRGRGCLFNYHVVYNFLKKNSLNRVIRAHECVKNGICESFHQTCITVFSASSYSTDMGNYSGILRVKKINDEVEYITFPPLSRLKKADAAYYKVQAFGANEKHIPTIFSIRHPQLVLRGNTMSNLQTGYSQFHPIKKHQSQYVRRDNFPIKRNCLCKPSLLTNQRKSQANLTPVPKSISMHRINPQQLIIIPEDDINIKVTPPIDNSSIKRQISMNRSGSIPDLFLIKEEMSNSGDNDINDSENFTKST
ncbi:hypothetical protein M9Y10_033455 [Tritrichomonas musculus]|uniref:Serine/threonine-protein phosphatase n=1 Tax=Tritrichomonas musculus TaxID=1915356 RepID=A0ABR2KCY2_9EUKA